MAARVEDSRLPTNLTSFKDMSKLGKIKLKQICKNLGVDVEKIFWGKKALINVVCNALGISTSRAENESNGVDELKVDISISKILSIADLQKHKDWKKSLLSIL